MSYDIDIELGLEEAHERIDELEKMLALAVSILEAKVDDEDVLFGFLSKAYTHLTDYYQARLPIDQFCKLNDVQL